MSAKLTIEHLSKNYGKKQVLKDIGFSFEIGRIYSIIGVNGAGKTTLFRCIDGDITYENGQIVLENNGSRKAVGFDDVGLVADSPVLPDYLTGYEYIYYFSSLHNAGTDIDAYFDLVRIGEEDRHRLIREYSFGMKNKLQILCCLIRKPPIILLDEPLSSFDIIVSHEIKELLMRMKNDHIIIMSTHIMQLAQDISDEIVLLKDGDLHTCASCDIHSSEFEQKLICELSK